MKDFKREKERRKENNKKEEYEVNERKCRSLKICLENSLIILGFKMVLSSLNKTSFLLFSEKRRNERARLSTFTSLSLSLFLSFSLSFLHRSFFFSQFFLSPFFFLSSFSPFLFLSKSLFFSLSTLNSKSRQTRKCPKHERAK